MASLQPENPLAPKPPLAGQPQRPPEAVPTPTPRPSQPSDSAPPPGADPEVESVTVTHEKKPDPPPIDSKGLAQKQADLETKVDAINKDTNALQPPTFEKTAPPKPKHTNPVEAWGSTAMLLAGIGSLMTRAPLTTALNAAAGVMNAYKQGDKEEADRQFEVWKTSNDQAYKQQTFQMEAYKAALAKGHNNVEEAIALTNSYAAAFKDETMMAAAKERNLLLVKKLHQDGVRNANMLLRDGKKVIEGKIFKAQYDAVVSSPEYANADTQERAQMLLKVTPAGQIPQQAIDLMADTFIKTRKWPPGMTKEVKDRAMASMGRKVAALNAGGTSNADIITNQGTFAGDQAALQGLKKMTTLAGAFERTTRKNMETAEKLMPKGAPPNLGPYLNEWVQTGRIQTGDKHAPAYIASIVTVANEYAKVMSGATGAAPATEGSRREAAEVVNAHFSKGQIKEVFDFMRQDMKNKTSEYFGMQRSVRREMATGMFDSAEDVGEALRSGTIDQEDATEILQEQFGYE